LNTRPDEISSTRLKASTCTSSIIPLPRLVSIVCSSYPQKPIRDTQNIADYLEIKNTEDQLILSCKGEYGSHWCPATV
jgi:hypothetical protein